MWSDQLRPTDTLAGYGGEEFALLLPHCDTTTAEAIVARLLETVPNGQSASCGIAEWDGTEPAEALTARADAALYMAKRGGRARAVLVQLGPARRSIRSRTTERLALATSRLG